MSLISPLPGLASVRCHLGLDKAELGIMSGVNRNTLAALESPDGPGPMWATVKSLAAALCCHTDDLAGVPSDARLAAIKVEFTEKVALAAKLAATRAAEAAAKEA